jgi:TIR domain
MRLRNLQRQTYFANSVTICYKITVLRPFILLFQNIVQASAPEVHNSNRQPHPNIAQNAKIANGNTPRNSKTEFRFDVAISFASDNKRDKVRRIAELLQDELGVGKVFFDEWCEAEIAGHDAPDYFQNVYGRQTQLVVVCVCARYNEKPWTQDEWRAIKAFERGLRDVNTGNVKRMRFLPLRFGEGDVDGLFSTAIVPDVRDRTPEQIVELIIERLRLSRGGAPTEDHSIPSGTDEQLLVEATRPYEPVDSREWYIDSRKRLQGLAKELLEECDIARKFILRCNTMPETTTAEELAKCIFESKLPMSFLRKCLRQSAQKRRLSEEERRQLAGCVYRLVDYVAPVCFTVDDLHSLEPHVNRLEGNYASVSTTAKSVAVSMVAGIKGVCADLNNYAAWEQYQLDGLPDSREIVSHLPPAPESGRRPSNAENPIAAFIAVLAMAIHPEQPTLEYVQAKLASLAEYDKIYFVVLFDTLPSSSYLETLHRTFPQLVLLVAEQRSRPNDGSPAADISLAVHIRDLRAEFGPQQSGNPPK